jgi:hypothetical protein
MSERRKSDSDRLDANQRAHRIVREATEQSPEAEKDEPSRAPQRCNKPVHLGTEVTRCFLEPGHLGPCKGV